MVPGWDRETDQLVRDVYDTVLDQGRWPEVLDRIARAVAARGIILLEVVTGDTAPSIRVVQHSSSYEPGRLAYYYTRFLDEELADQETIARLSGDDDDISLFQDDVIEQQPSLFRLKPNTRFLRRFDICHRAGALLNKDLYWMDRFAIQLPASRGRLEPDELATLQLLLPHVAKALALSRPLIALQSRYGAILGALDKLRIGVALLTTSGSIVAENDEFRRQTEMTRVLRRDPGGRLVIDRADAACAYQSLLTELRPHGLAGARPRRGAVLVGRGAERLPLCLEVCPIAGDDLFGKAGFRGFAVYSLDPENAYEVDVRRMAEVYALTDAEAAVLSLIGEGLSSRRIADVRETSTETVNTQVKSLLAKTAAENRVQLLRLATSFTLPLRRDE
jgi:DNA-binding CsgD family transcriptional regulator